MVQEKIMPWGSYPQGKGIIDLSDKSYVFIIDLSDK